MVENLRFASDINTDNKSASQAPLAPQRVEELTWLGLAPTTVAALLPYVTVLPAVKVRVNLNTASAEVIAAAVEGLGLADAQRLVAARANSHFRDINGAGEALGNKTILVTPRNQEMVTVASNYFEVHGRLRVDNMVLHERSLLQRNGTDVVVRQRERTAENLGALIAQSGRR
jgi:general secretion pathway protein K